MKIIAVDSPHRHAMIIHTFFVFRLGHYRENNLAVLFDDLRI